MKYLRTENLVLFGFHTTMSASEPGAIKPFWKLETSETLDINSLDLSSKYLRPDVEDPCSRARGDRHKPLWKEQWYVSLVFFFFKSSFQIFTEPGVIIPEWTPLCQMTAMRSSSPFTPFGICTSSHRQFVVWFTSNFLRTFVKSLRPRAFWREVKVQLSVPVHWWCKSILLHHCSF